MIVPQHLPAIIQNHMFRGVPGVKIQKLRAVPKKKVKGENPSGL